MTRVFRSGQDLLVYFEVYDPGTPEALANAAVRVADVSATVGLYQGDKKVFESKPVRSTA